MREKEQLKEQKNHGTPFFPVALYEWHGEVILPTFLHWHEEMEIVFLEDGNFTFHCDMKEYQIQAPAFLFIHPEKLHRIELCEKQKESALVFHLSMLSFYSYDTIQVELIEPILRGVLEFPFCITQKQEIFERVKTLYVQCIQEMKKETLGGQLKVKSFLLQMIAEAYDAQILIETKREEDESLQFMKKILHYLEQHYQEKIKIQQLADFIGMNPQYFCRFFKKKTGKTVITYLNEFRIEKIKEEIVETKKKMIDIAQENGFDNIGYFIKQFKKATGMTPLAYRKLHQKSK